MNNLQRTSKQIAVGTSVVEVSPELGINTRRKLIILTNVSTAGQIISVSFGSDAISKNGIVLYPSGNYSEGLDSAFIPSSARITAISDNANGLLAVSEELIN